MKLDPKNSEVKSLLGDLNKRTQKPGPKKATPSPTFPGIRTMFTSRTNPYIPTTAYDDDYDDEITKNPEVTEIFPKTIQPISKLPERRSKVWQFFMYKVPYSLIRILKTQ